jgi:hypothetical protein
MRKSPLVCLFLFLLATPALACSLCGSASKQTSLAHEFEQATVVVYGKIANPKLDLQPGKAGGGTTEFHIEKILKDDPAFPRQKMILLNRYLPILDAKNPPHFVMFFGDPKKDLQPYWGREINSTAILDFVTQLHSYREDPAQKLKLAAKHFDDPDAQVADEAFLVFATADDKLINQVAKHLAPAKLRTLIKNPDLEPWRLSMFAFLLGACGNADDAKLLRSLLTVNNRAERNFKAYEGILAGYVAIQGKEGWAFIQETLKSEKTPFLLRYAALRTMRFQYNAQPAESGAQVMQGLAEAINHADVADIAISDLRKWQRWDHTKQIVAAYDLKSHQSPIVKNSIIRYALACPQPEARGLVERARRQDPDLVRYLEEELK